MTENVERKFNIGGHVDRKHNIAELSNRIHNVGSVARIRFFNIEAEHELRVILGIGSDVNVELLNGQAEVHGAEMELNKEYSLKPYSSVGIFSWSGCGIKLSGTPIKSYFLSGTSMMLNLTLHASLEERRLQAERGNKRGPVLLVVGQNDLCKNALCQLLLNYAVRMGRHPLFVDINTGLNSLSLPSSISFLTVKKPADIVNAFDDQPIKIYYHGYRSAWENTIPYTLQLQRLNLTLQSDLIQNNQNVKTSGVIINGCDWSRCEVMHHGYGIVSLAIDIFKVDVVCVLYEEPLYLQLKSEAPENTEVLFIPKLDGVDKKKSFKTKMVLQDKNVRRYARLNEYFYGPTNQPRQPFTFEVIFSDVQVFKIGQKSSVQRYTKVVGEVKQNDAYLKPVRISLKLIDQILALSSADKVEIAIMYKPVTGFICVTDVDLERGVLTVISPRPGPLSAKILLKGDTRIRKCQSSKKPKIKSENCLDKKTKREKI